VNEEGHINERTASLGQEGEDYAVARQRFSARLDGTSGLRESGDIRGTTRCDVRPRLVGRQRQQEALHERTTVVQVSHVSTRIDSLRILRQGPLGCHGASDGSNPRGNRSPEEERFDVLRRSNR